jgi:S-adenosyl methyltransferase
VLVHARALLTSSPEGACGHIDCDVRRPGRISDEAGKSWISPESTIRIHP